MEGNFLFVTGREVKEEAGLEPGGLELLEADLADTTKKLAQIKIWIAGIEKEIADEPEPVWRQIGRSQGREGGCARQHWGRGGTYFPLMGVAI